MLEWLADRCARFNRVSDQLYPVIFSQDRYSQIGFIDPRLVSGNKKVSFRRHRARDTGPQSFCLRFGLIAR